MKRKNVMLALLLLCTHCIWAQHGTQQTPWYGGLTGGIPFGVSTFDSWGGGKTDWGWSTGAFAGYHFSPVWSLEISGKIGEVNLRSQECCTTRGYWLGNDGVRYEAPVLGMEGWNYAHLKSHIFVQRYGLQINMNVLGFFSRTKHSRWSFDLSPGMSAVGTKAQLREIGNTKNLNTSKRWHVGLGGDAMLQCRITSCFHVGVYSGVTFLTGKPMDGMPQIHHQNNFIWDSGLRMTLHFGKNKKQIAMPVQKDAVQEYIPKEAPIITIDEPVITTTPQVEEVIADIDDDIPSLTFPTIYFSFNSIWIEPNERQKIKEIATLLKLYPQYNASITGYTDTIGSVVINDKTSSQRAEAVKEAIVKQGVEASRLTTYAGGINRMAHSNKEARHATVVQIVKNN